MEIGEKYIHKFNPAITCEIAAFTENGYRVQQIEGKKKPKQAFFYKADFDVKNGFWVKQEVSENIHDEELKTYEYFRKVHFAALANGYIPAPLGYINAKSEVEAGEILTNKKHDMAHIVIREVQYDYKKLKGELMNLEL